MSYIFNMPPEERMQM